MPDNATNRYNGVPVKPYKNLAFDEYLTWRAIGGMIVTDTGGIEPMSKDQFSREFDVDLATMWRWSKMPGITEKISQRLEEIAPRSRTIAAWNRLLLLGLSSIGKGATHNDQRAAVDALKTYLGHFGELRLPVQRQDVKVQGGLMDILAAAARDGIIEGETIEPTNNVVGASQEAPGVLSIPS